MSTGAAGVVSRDSVNALADDLARGALPRDADALAELLTGLEELKATAAAIQARASVALAEVLVAEQRAGGVPAARLGRGVGAAIAVARRESPHAGDRWLGFAKAITAEMPHTLALLSAGVLSEYRATLLVRETACLSREDRAAVDAQVCADPAQLATWGNRRIAAEARRIAQRLDPASSVERHRRAVEERCVSLRPAPDGMTYLTALLPLTQGVAAYAALVRGADTVLAAGDPRSRGQIRADLLVQRLTGQAAADAVGVGVYLLMSDATLLDAGTEPAQVVGHGSLPAPLARALVTRAVDAGVAAWVRRLYQRPGDAELVGLDARSRVFPAGLADWIGVRDQTCRTPWCDAPIRHIDHVVPHAGGGATSLGNGQGLCEACNHHKQAIGWKTLPRPGPHAPVELTTPAGQVVRTRAPDPPASPVAPPERRGPPRPVRIDLIWPTAA